tara:strand:- start:356 stop:460 length:105 start_codon:yes stop_codon:yes gene_type:complete
MTSAKEHMSMEALGETLVEWLADTRVELKFESVN